MNQVAYFRTAAISSFVVPWLAIAVDFIPGLVPERLFSAVEETIEPGQLFYLAIAASVAGLINFVATIGLVLFQSWSRPLALASTIASLALYPLTPAMVQSGWAGLLFFLAAFAWGVTLTLAYCSPLSGRFSKVR